MRLRKIWVGMVSLIALTAVVQAATIVNWGASGGDIDIVTGNVNAVYTATYSTAYISPADGARDYDVSAAGQTRKYYGAMDLAGGVFGAANNSAGDQIQMVKNFDSVALTLQSMVAWESPDFLTTDMDLESLTMSYKSRGGTTTSRWLIETAAGWYQSDQTITGDWTDQTATVGDLTWSSYSLLGVTGGAVAADTANIISVGAGFTTTSAGGVNFAGAQLEYFNVTATGGVIGNRPPVAYPQSVDVVQNTFLDITLTGSDPEGSDLTYTVVDTTTNGVLSGPVTNLTYTPNTDYLGPDSFTFTTDDGETSSALATVSISVNLQSPPVANAQSVDVVQNSFLDITLTGSDPEGSNLTYSVVDTTTNGVLSGPVTNLTYTPNTDYLGPDSFTFTVNDGETNSAPATVSISVNLQEPPVADAQDVIALQNSFLNITLTGSDPEGNNLTYSVVDTPANGVLTGTAPDLTYTPATDYLGPDSFTFTANDGEANSEPATVSIVVSVPPAAGVMVQWGSAIGETDIVTADIAVNANNMQTTWDGDLLTGGYAGYYSNAGATRSPNIYGAGSIANEEADIINDASGDYMKILSNVSGYGFNFKGMLVWQDFLTTDRAVTDFSIMVDGRAGNTGTIQWLVEQDSQWYISTQTYAYADTGFVTHSANISAVTWNLFTPFSGGTAIIGAAATPTLNNVTAVGYYFDVNSSGNFAGAYVKYFQCRGEDGTSPYDTWTTFYGLSGDDALPKTDVELDGLDNLMEYALGGNPTLDDVASVSPDTFMEDVGGTKWFYHVHNQNTDASLTFTLGATPDLVTTAVDPNDVELVGQTAEANGFKTVTYRTEATTDAKFIELKVSK